LRLSRVPAGQPLFFLITDGESARLRPLVEPCQPSEDVVFGFFNPRLPDLMLGLAIGLSIALAWHWVAWRVF